MLTTNSQYLLAISHNRVLLIVFVTGLNLFRYQSAAVIFISASDLLDVNVSPINIIDNVAITEKPVEIHRKLFFRIIFLGLSHAG